jgi:hypothetical protein
MYQRLVSHNADIDALVKKGYAIAFDSNFLVVRDIPYLDHEGQLRIGAFVTVLEFIDQDHVKQQNHQVYFAGGTPYGLDGVAIPNLGSQPASLVLSSRCTDVVIERALSNKPKKVGAFANFFAKIESYVAIISGPAMDRYGVSPLTYRVDETVAEDSVFKFQDTLTSRAELTHLVTNFKDEVIALVGLGGTGAYLLDFLVKTPVFEIRAFDLDPFHVHNAFRSPGKLEPSELGKSKADVYASRYHNFRNNLKVFPKYLDATCLDDLEGVTFAFVCVDSGPSRAGIFQLLISKGIPFIDVGMGLNQKNGALSGMVRTTYFPPERAAALRDMQLAELNDSPDDLYKANIQIGELNALNASLAIIRYKQLRGFYTAETQNIHLLFGIADLKLTGESLDEI